MIKIQQQEEGSIILTMRQVYEISLKVIKKEKQVIDSRNYKLAGVVVNTTCPIQFQGQKDKHLLIDLMDDTFNSSTQNSINYMTVTVQAKPSEVNQISIGDIVIIKKYKAYLVGDQFIAKRVDQFSSFKIYKGFDENYNILLESKNDHQGIQENESLIRNLRNWFNVLIRQISFGKILNIGLKKQIQNKNTYVADPFKMLLKINRLHKDHLELIDGDANNYQLNLKVSNQLQEDDIVLINNIERISTKEKMILLTERSCILKLPYLAYDYKMFHLMKYQFLVNDNNQSHDQSNLNGELYEIINNPKLLTIIKRKYRRTPEIRLYTCRELFEIKKQQVELQPFYRVQAYVVFIEPQTLAKAFKIICKYCRQSYSTELETVACCQRDTQLMFCGQLALKDLSMEESNQFLEACLLVYDNNPDVIYSFYLYEQFFPDFPLNELKLKDLHNTNLNLRYETAIKKICEVGDNDLKYEFILEPLKYQGKLRFRIIDTQVKTSILQLNPF